MKAIKFTRDESFYPFKAKGPMGENLELCSSVLNKVVKLPAGCKAFYAVPLKRETADTVKLGHTESRGGYYLLVEGTKIEFVWETARFICDKFLYRGISNFRIEY